MDEIVRAAMAKWPNVPDCHGWLGLDARGRWCMRDDRCQAAGPFSGPGSSAASRGALLNHEKLIEFIGRNYSCDTAGCWYFQNGPQRVYVELEVCPWVWRIEVDDGVTSHTGQLQREVRECLVDEDGRLYLVTEAGIGLVHTQDVHAAVEKIEAGVWVPEPCQADDLPLRFGYVKSPRTRALSAG